MRKTKTILACVLNFVMLCFLMSLVHLEGLAKQGLYLAFAAILAFLSCLFLAKKRWAVKACVVLLCLTVAGGTAFNLLARYAKEQMDAPIPAASQNEFFSGQSVLIVVPHEDDEINLAGGVMEQYTRQGSLVSVLFTTNGDYYGGGETRLTEALNALKIAGVKEDDIYFAGFGDQWQPQTINGALVKHIYNSPDPQRVWTSHAGFRQCYGLKSHPCFLAGAYTRSHYVSTLKAVLKKVRPDVIYAVDYDLHLDHRAASLFFEEALGQLLKEESGYHPTVYKGFCYATAWGAENDFDAVNLLCAQNPGDLKSVQPGLSYQWERRVRLPMAGEDLSRDIAKTTLYRQLAAHASQQALYNAGAVLNGDKVFWQRRTDSALYRAQLFANGQPAPKLNDFKLVDSEDLTVAAPLDGVVKLSPNQQVSAALDRPVSLSRVTLYDDPDPAQNILGGYLLFEDGARVAFGALDPLGQGTDVAFSPRETADFSIVITDCEGDSAGLTEIEGYEAAAQAHAPALIKAMNGSGQFVYDYWLERGDSEAFTFYAYPEGSLETESLSVELSGDEGCAYRLENGTLWVTCPAFKRCVITVRYGERLTDTFSVANFGAATGLIHTLAIGLPERGEMVMAYQQDYYGPLMEKLLSRIQ